MGKNGSTYINKTLLEDMVKKCMEKTILNLFGDLSNPNKKRILELVPYNMMEKN